jgi:hypothetical protein
MNETELHYSLTQSRKAAKEEIIPVQADLI